MKRCAVCGEMPYRGSRTDPTSPRQWVHVCHRPKAEMPRTCVLVGCLEPAAHGQAFCSRKHAAELVTLEKKAGPLYWRWRSPQERAGGSSIDQFIAIDPAVPVPFVAAEPWA